MRNARQTRRTRPEVSVEVCGRDLCASGRPIRYAHSGCAVIRRGPSATYNCDHLRCCRAGRELDPSARAPSSGARDSSESDAEWLLYFSHSHQRRTVPTSRPTSARLGRYSAPNDCEALQWTVQLGAAIRPRGRGAAAGRSLAAHSGRHSDCRSGEGAH